MAATVVDSEGADEIVPALSSDLAEPLLEPSSEAAEEVTTNNEESLLANENNNNNNDDDYRDIVFCGRRMNHNVFLNLVLAALYGVSDNLWGGTVFCAYLKRVGGQSNEWVGNLEAVSGLASLFSALPVGFLADRYGRDRVIRAGGILIAVTAILHIAVLDWIGVGADNEDGDSDKDEGMNSERNMVLLGIIMACWGEW